MRRTLGTLLLLAAFFTFSSLSVCAVTVTLTVDEGVTRSSAISMAEKNLSAVLTEINRAQRAGTILTTNGLPMNDFSLKSLLRIWAVTPFYCDDNEVVERVWVFKDGNMMVSHIPLIITPADESFGVGEYQEAVVEFDRTGRISDFRFALSAQMSESLEHCGNVADEEQRMIIRRYMEHFRTAYNQKDIQTIEQFFSDDALIITGHVVMKKAGTDEIRYQSKVEYTKQNKQQYINNLRKAFARNKWIKVDFDYNVATHSTGCDAITQSKVDPTKFGVRVKQSWKSQNYQDEGILFLLWEFPKDGGSPIIHIRTWQPGEVAPDDNISTLSGFDL